MTTQLFFPYSKHSFQTAAVRFVLICLLTSLVACETESGMFDYVPIVAKRSELDALVKSEAPQKIGEAGKMYAYGNYVFLNEKYKGIHVINNANPRSPVVEAFVRIQGCVDIAVKDNALYADSGSDMLVLDVSNPKNIRLIERKADVFPELPPPDRLDVPPIYRKENRPSGTIIIGWKKKE